MLYCNVWTTEDLQDFFQSEETLGRDLIIVDVPKEFILKPTQFLKLL